MPPEHDLAALLSDAAKACRSGNYEHAVELLKAAIKRYNSAVAMLNLSVMISKGEGVKVHWPSVLMYAQEAARIFQREGSVGKYACAALQALDFMEEKQLIAHPRIGVNVTLVLMRNVNYNGAKGIVTRIVTKPGTPARAAVRLNGSNKVVSVALKKVQVCAALEHLLSSK